MKKFFPVIKKMNQAVLDGVFPGAVLLVSKNGETVCHEAFGKADIYHDIPMEKDSIFDLASLTKPLATALIAAKIEEEVPGFFNEKICRIIPEFNRADKNRITVEMLLNHTSGYPAHRRFFEQIDTTGKNSRQQLRQLLLDTKLESLPGRKQIYSDLGYMVMSWAIETYSGRRLDRAARKMIYDPLGIKRLFFIPIQEKKKILEKFSTKIAATQQCPWRQRLLSGEVDDENAWAAGGVEGHAGLFADAAAVHVVLVEVLKALQGKKSFFSSPVIQKMCSKKKTMERTLGFDTPSKTGSSSGKSFSPAAIGHLGFTGTSFWMDPISSIVVVLLTNRIHPTRLNDLIKNFRPFIHDLIVAQLV